MTTKKKKEAFKFPDGVTKEKIAVFLYKFPSVARGLDVAVHEAELGDGAFGGAIGVISGADTSNEDVDITKMYDGDIWADNKIADFLKTIAWRCYAVIKEREIAHLSEELKGDHFAMAQAFSHAENICTVHFPNFTGETERRKEKKKNEDFKIMIKENTWRKYRGKIKECIGWLLFECDIAPFFWFIAFICCIIGTAVAISRFVF